MCAQSRENHRTIHKWWWCSMLSVHSFKEGRFPGRCCRIYFLVKLHEIGSLWCTLYSLRSLGHSFHLAGIPSAVERLPQARKPLAEPTSPMTGSSSPCLDLPYSWQAHWLLLSRAAWLTGWSHARRLHAERYFHPANTWRACGWVMKASLIHIHLQMTKQQRDGLHFCGMVLPSHWVKGS